MKKELLLILGFISFLDGREIDLNQKMLSYMITFPGYSILKESFSLQEKQMFEKTELLEKVGGRTLLLTTVIRVVYYLYREYSLQEKERVLWMLLRSFSSNSEIEWAIEHMCLYVSRYGDDEHYIPWV